MKLLKITGFLLILNSHICQSKAGESPFEHGKKLPVVPFMVLDNFGMKMCLKECEAISLCYSINFYRKLLKCELNSVGQNESLSLITDQDYVYSEIFHPKNRTCGTAVTCNLQSKCIRTTFDQFVCMPIFCVDPVPEIPNAYIAQKTFSPPSVTYGCSSGYTGVGNNTSICVPGKMWKTPVYSCVPDDFAKDCVYGGIHSFGGKMYCFVEHYITWTAAKDYCHGHTWHLVEIESAEEQSRIISLSKIPDYGVYWIGLADQENEGTWLWSHSRSAPQNPLWNPGQPNGGTIENCVVLTYNGWSDLTCSDKYIPICEKVIHN
ncbi:uncharacterized protein LOC128170662 [Crassostrea angulata]|uniref:uncharacterized protein LOC128170662 n=1 Tax=Magallana angulata TaxID=2784310 RepID=UPI0022B163D0|nr:uncharacterized protein LOC128170662 [Crassostrea angulata]